MFVIVEKREFFGPHYVRELVRNPLGRPETFADRATALARVREMDGQEYRLAYGESGRPALPCGGRTWSAASSAPNSPAQPDPRNRGFGPGLPPPVSWAIPGFRRRQAGNRKGERKC